MIAGVRTRETHQNMPKNRNQQLSRTKAFLFCACRHRTQRFQTTCFLGFEPGWGNTVARAKDTMNLALNLLEAPDSVRLFDFLSRMPNMFNVVILSPHGFFGQKDVLGKPDTGGQVGLPPYAMSLMCVDCYRLLVVLCCSSCKLAGCSFACSCDTFRRHIPFFLLHFLPAFSQAVPCLHRPFFLCMYCASL